MRHAAKTPPQPQSSTLRVAVYARVSTARQAEADLSVIPPFLTGPVCRIHAARFSFCAGVIPPMPIFGRSLLYVQSHFVA